MREPDHRRRLDIRPDAPTAGVRGPVRRATRVGRPERGAGADTGSDARPDPSPIGVAGAVGLGRPVGLARCLVVGRPVDGAVRLTRAVALLRPGILASDPRADMEEDLVASGRFVRIEMQGERSGQTRVVTVGFVEDSATTGDTDGDGAVLVAAGSGDTAWARNLLADPACRVRIGTRTFDAVAEPLDEREHAAAVRDLILRYGTPAESLGHGPSFRLRPVPGP
jgi:deazaflavin-dependent oxidoreductase (nitroreductase family)